MITPLIGSNPIITRTFLISTSNLPTPRKIPSPVWNLQRRKTKEKELKQNK